MSHAVLQQALVIALHDPAFVDDASSLGALELTADDVVDRVFPLPDRVVAVRE